MILVVETVVADMKTGGASGAGKRAEDVHVHVSMKDETVVYRALKFQTHSLSTHTCTYNKHTEASFSQIYMHVQLVHN